ncbi:MAG: hypothetical protein L0Z48_09010 [candidate division Zixibacteria bacterium]|nr:hypothetical protein [candidate division Zixibacteria bacterium]MCI0596660.1 hypothetical protein [candidate division Zixibacteria bacterium]
MPAEINETVKAIFPIYNSVYQAVSAFHSYAFEKLGPTGGTALMVFLALASLAIVIRILRFVFDLLRYVLLPSAAVSGLLVLVTPLSFLFVFPISTAIFGVLLLIKS